MQRREEKSLTFSSFHSLSPPSLPVPVLLLLTPLFPLLLMDVCHATPRSLSFHSLRWERRGWFPLGAFVQMCTCKSRSELNLLCTCTSRGARRRPAKTRQWGKLVQIELMHHNPARTKFFHFVYDVGRVRAPLCIPMLPLAHPSLPSPLCRGAMMPEFFL